MAIKYNDLYMDLRRRLREAGAEVVAVAVVVDRATGAAERIRAEGLPYFYALGLGDIGLA